MLRRALFVVGIVTISVVTRADGVALSAADYGLTTIDTLPDPVYLDSVFPDALDTLATIAMQPTSDPSSDLGVQLRAIRTLPTYCPPPATGPCGVGTTTHDTLAQIVDGYGQTGTAKPADVLRLRAAIEALGIAGRSAGLEADYLRIGQFLNHPSRDVRATTARALGTLCNTQATNLLHAQLAHETLAQVQLAISAALRDLGPGQCH
jgi:hypothetical protein